MRLVRFFLFCDDNSYRWTPSVYTRYGLDCGASESRRQRLGRFTELYKRFGRNERTRRTVMGSFDSSPVYGNRLFGRRKPRENRSALNYGIVVVFGRPYPITWWTWSLKHLMTHL